MGHFTFSSPHYLIVLVIVPLLFLYAVVVRRRRPGYAVAFTNVDLVARLVARRPTHWWRGLPLILIALALATSTAALARPRIQLTTSNRTATIVLLVDISSSMQARDLGQIVGRGQSRLEAAVAAMHDFLGQVPSNDKIGLVTFSDKVQVLNQPTTNHSVIESGLAVLKPQGGTALGAGVTEAVKVIVSSLAKDGVHHTIGKYVPAAIVLESDGAQNRGTITPAAAAQLAKAAGIRIYGVALGKRYGYVLEGKVGFFQLKIPVPPDPGVVALLGRQTGRKAYRATTGPGLDQIYRRLGSTVGSQPQVTEITSWFEAAAAVFLVCGIGAARMRGGAALVDAALS